MFSFSEFSRVSGLSIELLRVLQQQEVLIPAQQDDDEELTAYDESQLPLARAVYRLGQIEVPL
ncbi:MAG: hypothetical protein ACIALR_05390, partial [Blastopirellula sp. JB062]